MKLSSKQRNVIYYNLTHLYGYLSSDEIDKLSRIVEDDLSPEDTTVLVGDVWEMSKDAREGVTLQQKLKIAEEIKSILKTY